MGLLDSVLGAVMNGQQPQSGDNAASDGLIGLIGLVASSPQRLQAITDMLGNDGAQGGLGCFL